MQKRLLFTYLILLVTLASTSDLDAQRRRKNQTEEKPDVINKSTFNDIKFRSIGPAFMAGRVADIAIHPDDESVWYVAFGSGGVWKTENAGTTWMPIFDTLSSYSIGCVTIDPNNPHRVWVGTGENVGGRHVGYGDGIYVSNDDGASWYNKGLKESEHISKIIVHPDNSEVIWVAVQGPLWNKGGQRGFYKSSDGGETWKKTLGDNEWTGVTDIVIDPRNPDRLYAATWQRHRNVAAYMGGGPGTALYKSEDGGETWSKLSQGLPKSNMGKIGLAISPQNPDILYAAIELDRRTGGVYRSEDRGMTWKKMSDAVSGATGPHYYQELYASPHQFEKLYLVDVRMQISEDGGKTFRRMNEENKHSDNHAIAFKKSDPDYLLVGCDGGVYETFDGEKTWRYIDNLPTTQYYKVAVDDAEPFYNIYGGTQDNNTHGGPSRTDGYGITNADWYITLFGDGHQPATEPGNPDIVYSEWQQGNLVRTDRTTGELVYIKPQPGEDEDYERFNWDAPILVSPHKPTRLYFASHRVWKSENRGDTWEAISGDLTKNQERLSLPIMGGTQSFDNPWDVNAMSNYNTITSLAESPLQEGLIYAGTDDGLIQITEDGGDNWRRINVGSLPGVPGTAFVNDIKADHYDANTAYVVLDNHKYGDFNPYILKSTDKGNSWQSLRGNLPDRTLLWRVVQDHEQPNLMFLAAEFGIYFTLDGGNKWVEFTGGLPTISFRDLAIQKRENDLIGASFGRSFYVLDDYSFLRAINDDKLAQEGALFEPRKAWWYLPRPKVGFGEKGSQGASYFVADNPDFGAIITYYLKEDYKRLEDIRKEKEREKIKEGQYVQFPGWETVKAEAMQQSPKVWLTVKDEDGNTIRKLEGSTKKGMHRLAWDLRYPPMDVIKLDEKPVENEFDQSQGMMAAPGNYNVTLSKEVDGVVTVLDGPVNFEVVPLREGTLKGAPHREVANFWRKLEDFEKKRSALNVELKNAIKRLKSMRVALKRSNADPGALNSEIHEALMSAMGLDYELSGSPVKQQVGEKTKPTIQSRISHARIGTMRSTYGPTPSHEKSLETAKKMFDDISNKVNNLLSVTIPELEKSLDQAGAPWVEGQSLPIGSDY